MADAASEAAGFAAVGSEVPRFLRDAIGGFARAMPGRSKAVSVADERA